MINKIESVEPCENCGEVIRNEKYKISINGREVILCEKCIEQLYIELFETLFIEGNTAA